MPNLARVGDSISHGGAITSGSEDTFSSGIPVARIGDSVNCDEHGSESITSGSPSVWADGRPVARIGSSVSCGATVTSGDIKVSVP